jgi:hypothetical protein
VNLPKFRKSIRELFSEAHTLSGEMILTDKRLSATAGVIASEIPTASFLVFIESPRAMLARTLDKADPAQLIENWTQSAKSILSLAHRFRSRVTVLAVQECLEPSSEFQTYIRNEIGLDTDHPYPRQEPPMALERALAELIVTKNQQLSRLYLEILATSHPLAHTSPDLQDGQCDPRDAISEIVSLRGSQDKVEGLEKAAGERESLSRQILSSNEQIKKLEESKKDLSEENDLLLLQLHQVQEELEHYFLEARRLEKNAKQHQSETFAIWKYGSLTLGEVHEESPYSHLNFTLDEAHLGDRIIRNIRLRLLKHHGRAGILLFQPQGNQSSPLHHWQQSGEEGGAPYMILIPQDESGADFFVAATTSDLLLLRGIITLLRSQLRNDPAKTPQLAPWIRVAGRLLEQIDDLPERLHYDSVSCKLTSREKSTDCTFAVTNAWIRSHGVAELSPSWSLRNSSTMTLSYSGDEPPLTIWPTDSQGAPDRVMVIDLSSANSRKEMVALFATMTKCDRSLLYHLVAEFPNFLVHLQNQHPDDGIDLRKLTKQARSFMKLMKKTLPSA